MLAALRGYKLLLSPLFTGSCRFTPSCADYTAEAVRLHGAAAGTWLGLRRLARCRPFGPWGADPVPAPDRRQSTVDSRPFSGTERSAVTCHLSTNPKAR